MVGTGITPEGINQNYMVYEFMLEQGYTVQPANITSWIKSYVERRYNSNNEHAIAAWRALGGSIYNDTINGFPKKTLIRGSLNKRPSLMFAGWANWYKVSSLALSWDSFFKSLDELDDIETVRYDAVDITRQMLQTIHQTLYASILKTFAQDKKNLTLLDKLGDTMLNLLNDLDRILATDSHFMMGNWIKDARAQGVTEQEKQLYEYNARNQVTLWGPVGNILDYAAKQWSSLVKHYYWPRWAMFVYYLKFAAVKEVDFNRTQFDEDVFNSIEEPFTFDKTVYPVTPTENSIVVAREMYIKWRKYMDSELGQFI